MKAKKKISLLELFVGVTLLNIFLLVIFLMTITTLSFITQHHPFSFLPSWFGIYIFTTQWSLFIMLIICVVCPSALQDNKR